MFRKNIPYEMGNLLEVLGISQPSTRDGLEMRRNYPDLSLYARIVSHTMSRYAFMIYDSKICTPYFMWIHPRTRRVKPQPQRRNFMVVFRPQQLLESAWQPSINGVKSG